MKSKLTMMVAMTVACTAIQLTAMPTEEQTRRAEPVVKKLLAGERAALESGRKTRSEVAVAAMKLADEADSDAAKLLLMKGAFVLYVRDGNLKEAVETMNALETAISDMPPQSVTNMIEMALLGVANKSYGARLYKLLDETKADIPSYIDPSHVESKAIAASVKERSSVVSILKGMIKVPGRDYWLSATELTQGQWEAVMGYNLSNHKGANLPVENVSRDDCDVFLEKLNATKEVLASRFEFRLPELEEWKYAAWAGSAAMRFSCSPASNVLDMAWVKENSLNTTHAVASKAPNAYGFYDMFGNVWEWLSGDAPGGGKGALKGCAFNQVADKCTWNQNWYMPKTQRHYCCGVRLVAHVRPFAPNSAPGSITELNLGNFPPIQFVYCPAGKFSMGYKEQPAISKVKEVEISSPFWVSKTPIRADQLESLGINSITNATGAAVITDASIVVQKLPSVLKERFGKDTLVTLHTEPVKPLEPANSPSHER